LFSIASNSKLFTVIQMGLALSHANLTWKTKVQSVLPSFQLMDEEAKEKTSFVELLSHQTGLARHDLSYELIQLGLMVRGKREN
jgi:CubicO group peptidase (beta-lactamase class C family)